MVLVAGGGQGEDGELDLAAELYDPTARTFTRIGNLNDDVYTATLLNDGTVLVTGGNLAVNAQIYNPITGNFTSTGSMLSNEGIATLLPNQGTVLMVRDDKDPRKISREQEGDG